jgi:hypothetical protein
MEGDMRRLVSVFVFAFVVIVLPAMVSAQTAGVYCEYWTGATLTDPAALVGNPSLLGTPTSTSTLTGGLVGPTNKAGAPFVARCTAKLIVPTTGNYTFWIAANKLAGVWLSSTTSFSGSPICKVSVSFPTPTALQWTRNAEQKSALKSLTAGGTYYLQVIHVAASATNHLALGWQLPSAVYERPIPASRLQKPPTVAAPLTTDKTTLVQGEAALLTWSAANASSCVASASPAYEYWTGSKAISGSQYVTPLVNEVLTLTCYGSTGTSLSSVTIAVTPAAVLNPRYVEFDPSADHETKVVEYRMETYILGAVAPIQTFSLGKPTPGTDGKIRLDFYNLPGVLISWPVPVGQYTAKVAAIGADGVGLSDPSNVFTVVR